MEGFIADAGRSDQPQDELEGLLACHFEDCLHATPPGKLTL